MSEEVMVWSVVAAIGLCGLAAIAWVCWHRYKLLAELNDAEGLLAAIRSPGGDGRPLLRAIRARVIGADPETGALVLSRSISAIRREYIEDEVAHRRAFWIGSLLTGVALICTFGLIAWVMQTSVDSAVRSSGKDSVGSTGALADAVTALGGKFVISAVGIGSSMVALLASNWVRSELLRAAEHPAVSLLAGFTTVETQQLMLAREQVAMLSSLDRRGEKLHSIEVSVKGLGNDISANLKNVMSNAIGEELKKILVDTMIGVDAIAVKVEESLSKSFGQQIQTLTAQLQESLAAVQKAVSSQGQGQLEQILNQLRDAVSGGFQSESQNMLAVMERFANVIPQLEQQLQMMMERMAEDARLREEEREKLRQSAEQGVVEISKKLEDSGAQMVSSVLGSSRVEIEAIVKHLHEAAEASARRHDDLELRAGTAAATVAQASEGLTKSAETLLSLTKQTQEILTQSKAGGEASQAASQQFLQSGRAILDAAQGLRVSIEANRAQIQEQKELLGQQREYSKEVERVWPHLFTTYLNSFKVSAEELSTSWKTFYESVEKTSRAVGSEFTESAESLSDSVAELVKLQARGRA